jgi:flagellin-like protein
VFTTSSFRTTVNLLSHVKVANRGVSSVIGVILMVAVVVILAAIVSVAAFGFVSDINEPAPNVADTTGEFELETDAFQSNQIVRIIHRGGDSVAVEEIEIIVRASGPGVDTEARLVDLPAEDWSIDSNNVQGDKDLIDSTSRSPGGSKIQNQVIVSADSNVWSAGDTIQFRIKTGIADFRPGEDPDADELEVLIVHTPSNAIISEHTFTP